MDLWNTNQPIAGCLIRSKTVQVQTKDTVVVLLNPTKTNS